jgi:hypothetical protein
MKRILSISLLMIFLFQMAGYYLVFKIQQHEIRKEFKRLLFEGIAEDKLVTFEIDDFQKSEAQSGIKFIEDHEILYRGTFYDIVRKEIHGSMIKYFCIADHDETRLYADLGRFVKDEMNKNGERKKQNSNYKQLLNPFTISTVCPNFKVFASDFLPKINYHFSIQLWNTFPLVPPPKA